MGKTRAWSHDGPIRPTPEEARWLERAARVMAECPSTLRLYVDGNRYINVAREGSIPDANEDLYATIARSGAGIGSIPCAVVIHSVAS